MSRGVAGAIVRTAFLGIGVAGALAASLSLPAFWLAWEAETAQTEAALRVRAAAAQAQAGLHGLVARFQQATEGLRAQDIQGDTMALTARLLRAMPLVAPASELVVINARGQQVASSEPDIAAGGTRAWFPQALASLHSRDPMVLYAGQDASGGWMLARRIENGQGGAAAIVASPVPQEALQALAAPPADAAGLVAVVLRDVAGHEVLRLPAAQPAVPPAGLVGVYRALLPQSLSPGPAEASVAVGGLSWVGSITPDAALGLRQAAIERHAPVVMTLTGLLAGLSLLLGGIAVAGRRRGLAGLGGKETVLRERLAALEGERDRVLAAIGHDVRTPINSILGICALLMDGDLDDAQRKWLRHIRASCETLLAMLNGMLEIAAARVDGAEIHRESVDVARLVEEVGEVLRPQAHDKGLDLHVAVEESALGVWNTDQTRLRQVLFNLAGNAVKYTAQGSVEIRVRVSQGEGGERLCLRVTDTGPGVAADEKEIIFEQFRRGRAEVSGGQEGLGLGLALCREIAALMGGSLSVNDRPSVGSVFTFEIPVERVLTAVRGGIPLSGRTALVVGLPEGLRRRVALHLESVGFVVETAADGFLALGLAERAAHQHGALDMVVIDGALTWLPADAMVMRLRANRLFERTRTVLVANDPPAGPVEARADATLPHPVETADLDRVVAEFFGAVSPLQEIHPRAPAASKGRVLVVEDNRVNQALFLDVLSRAGFSAFGVGSGEEAVEAAARGGFDAVLMDVQMPGIDGTEATRRIRAAEGGRRVPIIGLTAHSGTTVRKKCLDVGMDTVMYKPINLSTLPGRIDEAITSDRLRAADAGPDGAQAYSPDDAALYIADEYLQAVVAELGVVRARACVMEFLSNTATHIPAMLQYRETSDWKALGDLAHSVAGVAGTVGAVSLADGLLLLEDAARLKDRKRSIDALRDVQATWDRTRSMLRRHFEVLVGQGDDSVAR